MKIQSYKKGWAFALTLAMVFTTLFGGFGFLGINGAVGEVYAAGEDVTWSTGALGDITVTDGAIINVTGTVTLNGTITINGSAIITGGGIIKAGSGFIDNEDIILVNSESTLTLSGVTVDGNYSENPSFNLTGVTINGTLNMCDDAKITNFKRRGVEVNISAAVLNMHETSKITYCYENGIFNKGTTNMDGNAEINNCSNSDSGGIYNYTGATLNMSGSARITSCTVTGGWHYGGGVYNAGTFNISDNVNIVGNIDANSNPSNIFVSGNPVQITGSGLTADASLGIKVSNASLPTEYETVAVVTGSATHAVTAADAAYFSSDSNAHSITYSSIVASNTLFLVANGWAPLLTPETTPTAGFEASTMVLSGISSGMKYSINGGTSYIDITSNGSITISGITAANGIKVFKAGNGTTTTNSAVQTITITKAATPAAPAFTVSQPGTVGGKGTIAGITAAMEYSINGGSSWIAGGSTVSGLVGSTTVLVRIKGAGTELASDNCTITINSYIQTTLTNYSFEIPTLGATGSNWWTDYTPTTPEAKATFGWKTTATGADEKFEVGGAWNINGWGISFIPDGRQFIELNANSQAAVYQDLSTTPGSVIYWSLYQGGVWYDNNTGGKTINNTMAVRIGSPEQLSTSAIMIQMADTGYDQEWTNRTIYENSTMTAMGIAPNAYTGKDANKKQLYTEAKRWTKYQGTYTVPTGQTETRFAFASLSATPMQGNLLDGVVFRIANTAKAITAFNLNGLTPSVTGAVNETAKTIALTVPYGTDVTALVPTITHTGASTSPNSAVAQNFTSPVTYTVTSETGATQAYTVTVTVASNGDGGSGGGGGGHSSTPTAPANTTVIVNGQSQDAGITSTSKVGDKTVTTVTIDDKKIQEKIKEEGNQSTVSIPIGGSSDIGEGVLNGQTIKDMEKKESILEIKTNSTTYTLPASEINIDSVSSQFGQTVELKDIKISVKIAEPSADTTKIVQDTANKNNYQVVVKPVDFEITCTSGSKTITVSKFNGYVERMVAIPDGIDPSKVTTGIVLNNDGTFSHVPTTIVKIDGKYYAKINSLTNSTYSVIYNPIEFADVAKHWAKPSINEMGSRLVISGVGGNNYEPNRDITRAEFAAIVVRALGLAPDTAKNSFRDVADSKWYSGYVGTAASYGIISGYDTDTFAPNDKITREQAMTMVARAMAITDLDATTADLNAGTLLAGYSDTNKISGYAKAGISACLKTGVVTGTTVDTIAPKKNITRAEVAVIIERLLKKSELI